MATRSANHHSRKATKWQEMFVKKFKYDPNEKYTLSLRDNPYGGSIFGLEGHPARG